MMYKMLMMLTMSTDAQTEAIIDGKMIELRLERYKRSILLIGLLAEWQLIIRPDNNK